MTGNGKLLKVLRQKIDMIQGIYFFKGKTSILEEFGK